MTPQSIIDQIESCNCTVGSNPTPSESYHYNDLHRNGNTAVITEPKKKHYQQHSLLIRGGYPAEPAYHPNHSVARMWSAQR
jgi:hypothetical protein